MRLRWTQPTLVETDFPFAQLSLVARADRRGRDPAYGAHQWWARRPRSLIRGVVLASAMPGNTAREDFWSIYSGPDTPLDGLRVHDIFAGGGSTLIEGARLGATPSGSDVDPMSIEIVQQALAPAPSDKLRDFGVALIKQLRSEFGHLFPTPRPGWTPLHYFYVRRVECPECQSNALLYRGLVIARDAGKVGAVVRDTDVTAFCPVCLAVHHLDAETQSLVCCGSSHVLSAGTFARQKYDCPTCTARSDHAALATGKAELVLVAVEETHAEHRRAVRAPTEAERTLHQSAIAVLDSAPEDFRLPHVRFQQPRSDPRPVSYGMENVRELFSPRQQVILGRAFKLVDSWDADETTRRAVRLALSNALTTNNMLCGYAPDYGRLSPLFGVRSYCLPALSVELNPLQGDGGRGTLARCIDRACRASDDDVPRFVWDQERGEPKRLVLPARTEQAVDPSQVECRPASTLSPALLDTIDICFFDPPYFDFIFYDELSEFYRAWLRKGELAGPPVLPDVEDPVESFATALADCMKSALSALKPGRPFSFTYHGADASAWAAVGRAIDITGVRVTALWPLYSDGHMGHHSHPGNCEWDLLVVCRPAAECLGGGRGDWSVERWVAAVAPIDVGLADRESMRLGIEMAAPRFGQPRIGRHPGPEGAP